MDRVTGHTAQGASSKLVWSMRKHDEAGSINASVVVEIVEAVGRAALPRYPVAMGYLASDWAPGTHTLVAVPKGAQDSNNLRFEDKLHTIGCDDSSPPGRILVSILRYSQDERITRITVNPKRTF